MHGDLLYVFVVTLEEKRFHITASTRGFYVNQTTEEEFNPRPAPSNYLSHSLIELLNQISPGFKRNLSILQKRRTSRHPFERVATPYQVKSKNAMVKYALPNPWGGGLNFPPIYALFD